jgi:hypothetical protein
MVIPLDPNTALLAKHAQHVVLIHFPIALFISAVAFDFIAQWTKRRGMADTAYCPGFDCHLLGSEGRTVDRSSDSRASASSLTSAGCTRR